MANIYDFKKIEPEILSFWEKNDTYPVIKERNKKGKKFYFLQGPPYTSGKIHIGTAWNNILKDQLLRYKRMKGFNVWDRAGYDMHGLPTEGKVQKKLNLKFKDDILKYGEAKFVENCLHESEQGAKLMNEELWKLGIWMDFENAYMPIKKEYIEGEWWFIKQADKQKRLYKDKKSMTWCSHCETALAKHELEYKTVSDDSIFLKFRLKDVENEFLIIWTTTPWTIPFNLAVMVNPEVEYVKIELQNSKEKWIIAKPLVGAFMGGVVGESFDILEEFHGEKLEGKKYEHPLHNEIDFSFIKSPKLHTVLLSEEYVDTSAGTGLVHCAPGCGPEDFEVGKKNGLPPYNELDEKGVFKNSMGKYAGLKAKVDDNKFVEELRSIGSLIETTPVEHEYAHCWRCHNPVVFRNTDQWFLRIEDLKPKILDFNKHVHWEPKFGKSSYDSWTNNLRDNSITRQRFWGCPVPIWECPHCKKYHVFESVKELEKHATTKIPENLHKPWIDEVKISCSCGKEISRIPDVIDVWIDAGTASWNCLYYPGEENHFNELFPADFILEATEQVRLWFSILQICSSIAFGKSCYKNVYMHGMILDFQGTKMSKSLGNIISPSEVIEKYGVDVLRYYMCNNKAGDNFNFSWDEAKLKQRNLGVLWNIQNFLSDYKKTNNLSINPKFLSKKLAVEEKFILSRLHSAIKEITELLDEYKLDEVIGIMEQLYLDLSRVYIQLTREKASTGSTDEKEIVFNTIFYVYENILKMFSIVCPFITEKIYQNLKQDFFSGKVESIHDFAWPDFDKNLLKPELEKEMNFAQLVMQTALSARDKAQIGVRWPLSELVIVTENKELSNSVSKLSDLIEIQLNIKTILVKEKFEKTDEYLELEFSQGKIFLNTKTTPELEAEGFAREFSRRVQELRKKSGLNKKDEVILYFSGDDTIQNSIKLHRNQIQQKIGAKEILFEIPSEFDSSIKDKIRQKEFEIWIKKE